MINCLLSQLDSGKWWCPECDPDKRRLLPIKARRNCRMTLPDLITKFDRLLESGDDEAADTLAKRIGCFEMRAATGKPCGKS